MKTVREVWSGMWEPNSQSPHLKQCMSWIELDPHGGRSAECCGYAVGSVDTKSIRTTREHVERSLLVLSPFVPDSGATEQRVKILKRQPLERKVFRFSPKKMNAKLYHHWKRSGQNPAKFFKMGFGGLFCRSNHLPSRPNLFGRCFDLSDVDSAKMSHG